jgi:predicted XRE-type DNA-binding protein
MNNDFELVRGSGNVFHDLGRENAGLKQARAILAAKIIRTLDERSLSTREAERLTGISHSEFSRIRNAKLGRFSLDRMITILGKLDEEIEVRCNEYLDELASLLTSIAFLIKYPLITITEIELIKPKNEEVHYMHNMLILNSASSSFIGKNELHHEYVDTHSVILVKSLKNLTHDFLNLSPLIIDTYSERMESREKLTKVKKDIYLYSKWDMKRQYLQYVGTEAEEKPDIRMVSFYDHLVKNYEDIMSKFSVTE